MKRQRNRIPGRAKILDMESTGSLVNYKPQVRLKLIVFLEGKHPYMVIHTMAIGYNKTSKLRIGSELNILIDNKRPDQITVIWPDLC